MKGEYLSFHSVWMRKAEVNRVSFLFKSYRYKSPFQTSKSPTLSKTENFPYVCKLFQQKCICK